MFEGFALRSIDVGPARLNVAIGGSGPPLLLLHGYPQTHLHYDRLSPAAIAAYRDAFCRAEVRSAIFNDYRAGATLDSEHDAADRKAGRRLQCPVFVTWEQGRFASGETPIDIWRTWADSVDGTPIDAGHLQAEEAPDEVLAHVLPFLRRHGGS